MVIPQPPPHYIYPEGLCKDLLVYNGSDKKGALFYFENCALIAAKIICAL